MELAIYAVIIGVATAVWLLLGRWAWEQRFHGESICYFILAASNGYGLLYTVSRLFGDLLVVPLESRFIFIPTLLIPPLLLLRGWRRFRALINVPTPETGR